MTDMDVASMLQASTTVVGGVADPEVVRIEICKSFTKGAEELEAGSHFYAGRRARMLGIEREYVG